VNIDHDLDGFITHDNFKKCFSTVMSSKKIQDLFWDPVAAQFRQMEISEFLEVIKPKESSINKEIVRT
jgi:Ca2+-binding EF-hand superfamily protein